MKLPSAMSPREARAAARQVIYTARELQRLDRGLSAVSTLVTLALLDEGTADRMTDQLEARQVDMLKALATG